MNDFIGGVSVGISVAVILASAYNIISIRQETRKQREFYARLDKELKEIIKDLEIKS
jgi:hypothetical protein